MILNRLLREPSRLDPTGGVVDVNAPKSSTSQKPAAPRTPTPDELKGEFKVEPGDPTFVESFETQQLPPADKKPDEKKEEKKAEPSAVEAPKQEEPIAPKEEPAEQKEVDDKPPVIDLSKPIVPVGTAQKARDYSGFTPEEVKVLKGMSNESFAYTSNLIKQNKELAQLKDSTYLQHPNAYILDPQYQQEQQNVQYFNQEAEYWQSQLALIKAGKEWSPLKGWSQDGKPIFDSLRTPNPMDEEQVRMAMNQCFNAAQQSGSKLQQFAATYNQRIQAGNSAIQAEQQKRFGWVADPKLLDSKIQVDDKEKTLKEVKSDFINLIPPYHRGHILADVGANLFTALMIYGHQIRLLQNGKQVAETKAQEVTRAEPTSNNRPAANGKTIGGVKEFSLAGVDL